MRLFLCCLTLVGSGCALLRGRVPPQASVKPAPTPPAEVRSFDAPPMDGSALAERHSPPPLVELDEVLAEEEEEDEGEEPIAEEGESHEVVEGGEEGPLYTADLSDELLAERFLEDPSALGSMSVGFVDAGRLLNGVRFPSGDEWLVVSPDKAFATEETIQYVQTAIKRVREQYPEAPPLRVNQISGPEGGWLRPHKSHQTGRDVDLGFYYPTVEPVRVREREKYIDVPKNWALVKALVTETDVQLILVDRRIIKVLYQYALSQGEDPQWLESIFRPGPNSLVRHARRHRDHFHVRFFNPRAQELGRRVAPLLAKRPETNLAFHKVRSGDTLSGIAARYGSSVKAIRTSNRMKSNFLRLGVVLSVPLRKPCTQCPVPPPVVVPPRRLPASSPVAASR